MKLQVALILAFAIVVSFSSASQAEADDVRTAKLPSLFDFAQFKSMFHKHYASLVEELARQKIFLGRAFRAFISMVKYRYRQMSSFLRVNQMSDETPEERARRYLPLEALRPTEPQNLPVIKLKTDKGEIAHQKVNISSDEGKILPVASLEEIESQLKEIERNKDRPGYHELAEELERIRGDMVARKRRKRDAPFESIRKKLKRTFNRKPKPSSDVVELKPEREPEVVAPPVGDSVREIVWNLPGSVSRIVKDFLADQREEADEMRPLDEEDVVGLDLRQNNCFFQPRNQAACGSCWAFVTVALFEYMFCMETGQLVAFSEQYMIDCGRQLDPPLDGCDGGTYDKALEFVRTRGLELRVDYPYLWGREDTCPFSRYINTARMGRIRVERPELSAVPFDQIDTYLREYQRPLLMAVTVSDDFSEYGGGVDGDTACEDSEEGHAMLLIGYGREEGEDYYLFRNSHSVLWGEQGHYKLAKSQLDPCSYFEGAYAVTIEPNDKRHYAPNPRHDVATIKAHYKDHLKKYLASGGELLKNPTRFV